MPRVLLPVLVAIGMASFSATNALAAEPSPGCGTAPGKPPETLEVGGRERHAIVALPADYSADRPHPLIFAFQGRTNDNARARGYFGLEEAMTAPMIFVYPAGLLDATGRFTWWDLGDPPDALRDFSLFDALLDRMGSTYCLNLDAVYVVGHSLGATFANSLACARADRIRGLASVAGGISTADCSGAIAALLLHNPRDRDVPVSEGARARDTLLGHPADRSDGVRRRLGAFQCRQYGDGANPILWCLHGQDVTRRGRFHPHQWPQGASGAIVGFFDALSG